MKRLLAVLILIFASAITMMGDDDISRYKYLGRSDSFAYLVDMDHIEVKDAEATFDLVVAAITSEHGGKIDVSQDGLLYVTIQADCGTREFSILKREWSRSGIKYRSIIKDPKKGFPEPESDEETVIDKVCIRKIGVRV